MKYCYSILFLFLLLACTKPQSQSIAPATNQELQDGERYITLNGIRHWVKIAGSEHNTTPLVIVHGGPGGNNYTFERTAGPGLEKAATIVYYEQRGCGRSEAPADPNDYTLPVLISDLDALRDSLGVPKISLLGYSFGAELSLRYALAHPDRVEKLILSSPAELSPANMLVQIQGFYAIGDSTLKTGIEQILQDTTPLETKYGKVWGLASSAIVDKFLFLNQDKAQLNRQLWQESKLKNTGLMAKVYLQNNKADLIPSATGLQTPTLIISGVYDKNGGLHTGLSLKQVLPNSTLKLYENSAHFPDIEETSRFATDVKAFISSR
ncbi:alpha/beta hydrolase [Pontibacter sp. Tf4]|uniref:alpha/beta fold hydrolase n=1 Tax=Pontibacter sp. Tf4 TaxID=2761620 RepID=UPI0016254D5F|nr:alpha/beta hydrolase [Pontibacter sp. Tf4]MBB6610381.1 alpha/beta hydrolase [Pontibacter sp. Tf4]